MAEAYKPINGGGIQLRPFNAYKRWVVTNSNFRNDAYSLSVIKAISPEYNELITISESIGVPAYRITDELDNSNSNSTPFINSKHQKVIWSGLNQTFYKHRPRVERDLYVSASILSVPHNRMGDGIRPGTIEILDNSATDNDVSQVTIKDIKLDEYHGQLIDNGLDTGSYVPFGNLVGYWGFNDEVVPRFASVDDVIEDRSGYLHNARGKNIQYTLGIPTTGFQELPSGTKATFNGSDSYMRVDHNRQLDFFTTTDYALSMWAILPPSQLDDSGNYNWLISKSGTYRDYGQNNLGVDVLRRRNVATDIYPFDIKVSNQNTSGDAGKIYASLSNGTRLIQVSSSTAVNDSNAHHILVNKSGSHFELWIDGIREDTTTLPTSASTPNGPITMRGIHNTYDMLFGSRFTSDGEWDVTSEFGSLSGSLDEIRIYNRALVQSEIEGLADNDYVTGSAYQTAQVGEVFYKHGLMVVSDPRPLYRYTLIGETGDWDYGENNGWQSSFKSTKELHELNVMCEVGSNEFNVSQNPTLKKNNDVNSSILKPFVTGSDFKPYFTTIGLYNSNGDLVAIGKLASAIQNRDDVDITIKVRLDLDGAFGAPGIGSLATGSNATVYQTSDGKYIWNKLDRPDILV